MHRSLLLGVVFLFAGAPALADDVAAMLDRLKKVAGEGANNPQLSKEWKQLSQRGAEDLPAILASLAGAEPLAANWIHSLVDVIAERELAQTGELPAKELEAFLIDRKHDARARRLAYEWLLKVDASAPERIIPRMLDDPSVEFRREAVDRLIDEAKKLDAVSKTDEAKAVYVKAMAAARDEDQVRTLTKRLQELGQPVNLQRHFGFLANWKVIGPFDNTDKKGFDVAYPPEKELKFDAKYPGKVGEVGWTDHSTQDDWGLVDMNKAIAKHMGAAGYAHSEFMCDEARPVELRMACKNAFKVWVNGQFVFGRDEYHRGKRLDQYTMPANMKAGKNVILVKVCQNEQKEEWAQEWDFQLRVCDASGTAVLSSDRLAAKAR